MQPKSAELGSISNEMKERLRLFQRSANLPESEVLDWVRVPAKG